MSLRVYDMRGQVIRTLVREFVDAPGRREAAWDGTDDRGRRVAGGVYLYRLEVLREALRHISPSNAQNELYLTDPVIDRLNR